MADIYDNENRCNVRCECGEFKDDPYDHYCYACCMERNGEYIEETHTHTMSTPKEIETSKMIPKECPVEELTKEEIDQLDAAYKNWEDSIPF
jgi:hypothetical protein